VDSRFDPATLSAKVVVSAPDGSAARALAAGADPAWSPDGSKIAFTRGRGAAGDPSQVFVMNADGSHVRRLTNTGFTGAISPAWAPDGKRIAYADLAANAIVVMDADGSAKRTLVRSKNQLGFPDWSPDGRRIVFDDFTGLWVVNADGTGSHRLLPAGVDRHARWSPDGSEVVFQSGRARLDPLDYGARELFVVDADGRNVRPLTFTRAPRLVSSGVIVAGTGRKLAAFETDGQALGIALGGDLLAVLTNGGAMAPRPSLALFDARSGKRRAVLPLALGRSDPQLGGISGGSVVFAAGRAIRRIDADSHAISTLTVTPAVPVGLSVSHGRLAWAENLRWGARIRAVQLSG
jgi:dipeptidyl aminopeptidase/acylaminoacyl peptidase